MGILYETWAFYNSKGKLGEDYVGILFVILLKFVNKWVLYLVYLLKLLVYLVILLFYL